MPPDRNERVRQFLIGVLAAIVPALGGAWALATVAADHVLEPHLAKARERVHIMCLWAKVSSENDLAICEKLGATCKTLDAKVLLASCEETHAQ
jgi:hypothetical protein